MTHFEGVNLLIMKTYWAYEAKHPYRNEVFTPIEAVQTSLLEATFDAAMDSQVC